MNIRQCSFCKRPFQSLGKRICPACLLQIDKDFFVVRDYIYENKQANMDEVFEKTGISKQVILYLLKEGRLVLDDDGGSGGMLKCEVCKKAINSGRLCKTCKDRVANTMQKSYDARPAVAVTSGLEHFKGTAKLKK
ncbi:MAG: flagellar protein [Oscillospiraceae bacterium]|nr:flagellar protein [Oscillospiraceae bacterium]